MQTVRLGLVLPIGHACAPAPGEVPRSGGLFEAALGRRSPSLPILSLVLLAACLIAMGLAMTRHVLYAVAVAQRHGAGVEMPNRLIARPQPRTGDPMPAEFDKPESGQTVQLLGRSHLPLSWVTAHGLPTRGLARQILLVLDNFIIHKSRQTLRPLATVSGRIVLHLLTPYSP